MVLRETYCSRQDLSWVTYSWRSKGGLGIRGNKGSSTLHVVFQEQ